MLFLFCASMGGSKPALAVPGQSWIALSPAPFSGDLDIDAYLTSPVGWSAHVVDHDRGWAVAYRHRQPPVGWSGPFVIRGGGAANRAGVLHPRFAVALEEMLPSRASAIVTMRNPPDVQACSPGQPNPDPFLRRGWLGLHDGSIGIEDITMRAWRADWGTEWEEFKRVNPRDFHGRGDSTRGEAGEIYFLTFLYEWSRDTLDVSGALERTVQRMLNLDGVEFYQINLLVQSTRGAWAVRCALSGADDYPVFYGLTRNGEYWVADDIPVGAIEWQAMDNFTLACFPAGGPVELRSLDLSGVNEDALRPVPGSLSESSSGVRLRAAVTPCAGPITFLYQAPAAAETMLEIWDVAGRRVLLMPLPGGSRSFTWPGSDRLPSGLYFARLHAGAGEARARSLILR
jgi:hypothetical protein